MIANSAIIEKVCASVKEGAISDAKKIIENNYPFIPLTNAGRKYSEHQKTKIFLRDGFIDRYTGERMMFPPVLRLLSTLMPQEFPFHKNWKMTECHIAYWQLMPTVDHVVPVSRGGKDEESNWVCTSQLRNSAKSNWLLDELGWKLHSPGDASKWDGMLGWFVTYVEGHSSALEDGYIEKWHNAAIRSIET